MTLQEWEGLPAPYKYLGVKLNPAHVENHGMIWKALSDWKIAVPAVFMLSLPMWMFNWLPPFDERAELGLITVVAGVVAARALGAFYKDVSDR
jgi:hypothetical protein